MADPVAVFFSPDAPAPPAIIQEWLTTRALAMVMARSTHELMGLALRSRPRVIIFDAASEPEIALRACRRLKSDSYTGVIPAIALSADGDEALQCAFSAGADEIVRDRMSREEIIARLDAMLRRAERDLLVHPSTRLPGSPEIEAEILRRIRTGNLFGVCYADLDHFKEYNDRYSYAEGDRVIRILAQILHDVVKGICPDDGFVGHIGGDDFICIVPPDRSSEICAEVVEVFDLLVPYQYSMQDRRAGYYFGKDRRGQLHRVPLMTVSIGVVTNERRRFTHPAQVSELATEMKSYAKTLPGSVYAVDRRQDAVDDKAHGGDEVKATSVIRSGNERFMS
ncbi:MAG: GGDEF domain-containing protein [Gemmatimonadaceae bacterium]